MKITAVGAMLFAASLSVEVLAMKKVLYGADNRSHVYESHSKTFQNLALSSLAMIPKSRVELKIDELKAIIKGPDLVEEMRICQSERFAQSLSVANCSAFLVGPDLVATAGHCVRDLSECKSNYWVFDFREDSAQRGDRLSLPSESVYECAEVVVSSLSTTTMSDYALIRLNRAVEDRSPLAFRSSGKIADKTPLVVIGHPSGLPTIISDGAWVREGQNDHPFYFRANLDAFGGNSGSAVFNAETGEVEGILVRGENDYTYDIEKKCFRPFQCVDEKCRGEDVTRITVIPQLVADMIPTSEEMEGFLADPDDSVDVFGSDFDTNWFGLTDP